MAAPAARLPENALITNDKKGRCFIMRCLPLKEYLCLRRGCKMIKTVLQIEGMSCGMCEAHINDTIRRTFNVKSVKSSHKKKSTEILSELPIDEKELKKAISATGYTLIDIRSEEYIKKGFWNR